MRAALLHEIGQEELPALWWRPPGETFAPAEVLGLRRE